MTGRHFSHDRCVINFFHFAGAERGKQFLLRFRGTGKNHKPRRISVKAVNEIAFPPFLQCGKDRFRIYPALLVDNEHVFVLVNSLKRFAQKLRFR